MQTLWLCNLMEPDLLPIEVLHCKCARIGILDHFCYCDLDLDLDWMTFISDLHPYSLEIYWMCELRI